MKKQKDLFKSEDYITEGVVDKKKIKQDIRKRSIQRKEIWTLIQNVRIQKEFEGVEYSHKKPIKEWSEEYLEMLSFSNSFNPDFLFYLDDVANYLAIIHHKIKEKKKKRFFFI